MNMNKEYVQGFIDRCAEAGVDPEQLVKTAGGGKSMGDAIGRFMPRLLRGNKTEAELKAYNAARKKLWEANRAGGNADNTITPDLRKARETVAAGKGKSPGGKKSH